MRNSLLVAVLASAAALVGCNKPAPTESAPTAPTATESSMPKGVAPASSPASDPSLPDASAVVSSPASAASVP